MGPTIKTISEKNVWEDFLKEVPEKTFLQSWNWGDFNLAMGEKIWRLGIYEQDSMLAVVLVVKVKARRGTFLFVPHGPAIKSRDSDIKSRVLEALIKYLKALAKNERASFIRISPIFENSEENVKIFKRLRLVTAPIHVHPELTWELDLSKSEEDIWANMRKTTRYLIRQSEKNPDIEIIKSRNINDLEEFNKIYQETAKRHNFSPFSLNYLKNEFTAFGSDDQILIFLGKYKGEVVSCAMIIFWQGTGFYHQGASLAKFNKIPVSYLLQWEAIKEAEKRGCRVYNFWGIAPTRNIKISKYKHPWAGLSLFKMGFGGREKEYIKTQDLPLKITYWLTNIFEKIRRRKRGL